MILETLVFAAITLNPTLEGTLFKYPSNIVDEVSSEAIPGSSTNSGHMRLDSKACAVMVGMLDGILGRQILPTLANYAGAVGKQSEDLRASDWLAWKNGVIDRSLEGETWPTYAGLYDADHRFLYASNRNFSAASGRIWKLNKLIDDYVLGDVDGEFSSLYRNPDPPPYGCWLLGQNGPGRFDRDRLLEMPTSDFSESWRAVDPFSSYAISLGELRKDGLKGVWANSRIGDNMAAVFNYMHHYRFHDMSWQLGVSTNWYGWEDDHLSSGYIFDWTNASIRAGNYSPIADVMSWHAGGKDFTAITNRPTRRVWRDRLAFANALLAAQRVSLQALPIYGGPMFVHKAEISDVNPWGSPEFRFEQELYNGTVRSQATYKLKPESYAGVSRGDQEGIILPTFRYDDLELVEYSNTNIINCTTNYVTEPVCAWVEDTASMTVSLKMMYDVTLDDFNLPGNADIGGEYAADEDGWVDVWITSDRGLEFFLCDRNGLFLPFSSAGLPASTNWNVNLNIVYNGDYCGNQFLSVVNDLCPRIVTDADLKGKTEEEFLAAAANKTILPAELHPISGKLISEIRINYIDTLLEVTNKEQVASIAHGGQFALAEYGVDSFVKFRTVAGPRVPSHSEMVATLVTMYDEVHNLIVVAGSKKQEATSVSPQQLKNLAYKMSIFEHSMSANQQWILEPTSVKIRSKDGMLEIRNKSSVLITAGFTSTIYRSNDNAPFRPSKAMMFLRQPHAIVFWNFPAIGFRQE